MLKQSHNSGGNRTNSLGNRHNFVLLVFTISVKSFTSRDQKQGNKKIALDIYLKINFLINMVKLI